MLTNSQLLDAVETAISAVLSGGVASYSITAGSGGRQVTALDLPMLLTQRDRLIAAVNREAQGSFGVAEFRKAR